MNVTQTSGVPRASGDEPYLDKWFDKVNSEFPAQAGMNR